MPTSVGAALTGKSRKNTRGETAAAAKSVSGKSSRYTVKGGAAVDPDCEVAEVW